MTHSDNRQDVFNAGINDEVYASYLDSMRKSKPLRTLIVS